MAVPYQRRHQKLRKNQSNSNSKSFSFDIFYQKPFWIWDKEEHLKQAIETNQNCCFNHIVGLPVKDGKQFPLFDYEKIMYNNLILESEDKQVSKRRPE
jgi:hypothetical protein